MNRSSRRITGVAVVGALVLAGAHATAAVPAALDQQGRFLKADGSPETGSLQAKFALYDAAAGGTALWSELKTLSLDGGGLYATTLGVSPPFPPALWDGRTLFLGITVAGEEEMAPRQAIVSVPYAFKANVADDAIGDIHPKSITVNGKTIVNTQGAILGAAGPAGPKGEKGDRGADGASAMLGLFSAQQSGDLKTAGTGWTAIPGTSVTFHLDRAANLALQADGAVTGIANPGNQVGHCGFRFVVDDLAGGNPAWGDRIVGCADPSTPGVASNQVGPWWCSWSMRRIVANLAAGDHSVRLEQTGWAGTPGGCSSVAQEYSAAKLWVTAY